MKMRKVAIGILLQKGKNATRVFMYITLFNSEQHQQTNYSLKYNVHIVPENT